VESNAKTNRIAFWLESHFVDRRRHDRLKSRMAHAPFALTGVFSRSGLSNSVIFFFSKKVVLIDLGFWGAFRAGTHSESTSYVVHFGALNAEHLRLHAWRRQLEVKSKKVRVVRNFEIREIRLHMKMTAHELVVVGIDGMSDKFGFINRAEAEAAADPLSRHFGSRFIRSTSTPFSFFNRLAPFLTK
jgi:hypothetical protein